MGMKFEIIGNDISDGYHTFGALYDHRCTLYLLLCLQNKELCYWRPHYEGWLVLYMDTPLGQVSYHLPESLFIDIVENAFERRDDATWDGHTSPIVLDRLLRYCASLVLNGNKTDER